jgi:AcrR family transcriptional regulator
VKAARTERTVHRHGLKEIVVPPRERILIAARDLFYRHGIQGVGVDAIAEAAGTNKMTLYRHFESKELLVAEYLRGLAAESEAIWSEFETAHPGDPLAQIHAWLAALGEHVNRREDGGCALLNAAIQISDPDHPGRKVIEQSKRDHRERLIALCRASGLMEPEMLADQLFLLVEGSRVSYRSVGPGGPMSDIGALAQGVIAAHRPRMEGSR